MSRGMDPAALKAHETYQIGYRQGFRDGTAENTSEAERFRLKLEQHSAELIEEKLSVLKGLQQRRNTDANFKVSPKEAFFALVDIVEMLSVNRAPCVREVAQASMHRAIDLFQFDAWGKPNEG